MIFKGIVSSIEAAGTRLILPDKSNIVTIPLPSAAGIGSFSIGDKAVVVFFTPGLQDGLILAKY